MAILKGGSYVGGDFTVSENLYTNTLLSNGVVVRGSVDVEANLTVTGTTYMKSDLQFTGAVDNYISNGTADLTFFTGSNVIGTTAINASGGLTGATIVKTGGLSTQFLKADGSVDSTAYTTNTGTVTSVSGTGGYGGLTLGGTVTASGNLTLGGTPTGTWPISVTGSSGTASYADSMKNWDSTNYFRTEIISIYIDNTASTSGTVQYAWSVAQLADVLHLSATIGSPSNNDYKYFGSQSYGGLYDIGGYYDGANFNLFFPPYAAYEGDTIFLKVIYVF